MSTLIGSSWVPTSPLALCDVEIGSREVGAVAVVVHLDVAGRGEVDGVVGGDGAGGEVAAVLDVDVAHVVAVGVAVDVELAAHVGGEGVVVGAHVVGRDVEVAAGGDGGLGKAGVSQHLVEVVLGLVESRLRIRGSLLGILEGLRLVGCGIRCILCIVGRLLGLVRGILQRVRRLLERVCSLLQVRGVLRGLIGIGLGGTAAAWASSATC